MSGTLRTDIVGVGKVTDLHSAALASLKHSEFTAVCSRSKEKAREYAARFGIKGYTDVAEMVSGEKIDLVIVCTPHPNHRVPAVSALEAGAHVL